MRFQFNSRRPIRLFTTHSTRRAVFISAFVFSAAIAMGYIGTAANPDVARKVSRTINTILGNPSASAKDLRPEFGEVVASHLTIQDPVQDPLPPLTTDKTGYLAGQTVIVSGTGFWANETITIQVTHTDGTAESGMGHEPSTATAGENGAFNSSWSVPTNDAKGHNFTLTATGNSSAISSALQFNRIATIKADKLDYQPGETAAITGEGFQANEVVVLLVVHSNGNNFGAGHQPFEATADSAGRLTASWYVNPDDSEGSIFRLTASGQASGLVASSTFYDPPIAFIDDAGPDDEPGQKDLNAMSSDLGATSVAITWNWDDTDFGNLGGNTGDACALVDTDQDGFANFAFCVVADGDPAGQVSNRLYSCADTRSDRCAGPTAVPTFTSSSTASVVAGSDPFKAHPAHSAGNDCDDSANCLTDDTVANVTLQLSDVGGASAAKLLNVCSYPSQEPNSDPSDCVIAPDQGFLTIRKTTQTNENTTTTFAFNTSVASVGGVSNFSANITGQQTNVFVANQVLFAAGTLNLSEVVPTGWDLTGASCAIQTAVPTPTGSFSGNTITGLTIQTGLETICTFTNGAFNVTRGKIIVDKDTVPDDSQMFTFTPSYNGGATFQLNDASTPNDSGFLTPGTYSVSETANTDYATTATCTSNLGHPADDPSSINLAAGEIVTCTFTNTKRPKLTVTKTLVPASDSGLFNLQIDGVTQAANVGDGGSTGAQFVSIGSHTVGETAGTATALTDYTTVIGGDCDAAGNVTLAAGDSKTCTITNTRRPKLTVTKTLVPASDSGLFNLQIDGVTQAANVGDGGSTGAQFVSIGSHTVGETAGTATALTDYTTVIGGDCDAAGNVTLAAGDSKTCTITNTRRPKLTVTKTLVPASDSGLFNLQIDGVTQVANVGDGGSTGAQFVSIGSHTVGETAGTATALTDYTTVIGGDCDAAGNVTLAAGDSKTCTITNTRRPKLTVTKTLVPASDSGLFNLQIDGVTQAANVGDGGSTGAQFVSIGSHTVGETAGTGTSLNNYVTVIGGDCDAAGNVTLAAGDSKTCTITNTRRGKIIVEKQTNPNGATGNFTFTGDAAGTISDNGTIEVPNLTPGTYYSTEGDPTPGFDLTSISCDDGASATPSTFNVGTRTATFKVDPGETVKCTFNNTKRGKIIVEKQTNPNGATGNFTFTGDAAGTISDNGTIEVPNLAPGTYYSTEGDPTPGFDLTSIVCDDSGSATPSSGSLTTRKATFKLDPGETVKCTFTNTQRGMVVVNKTTNGSAATMPIFNFSLTGPNVPGGPNVTTNDVNDANGVIDFGGRKILPNVTYTVCELVPAGYTSFWRADINGDGTAEIITPYNPNASDVPPQDLGVRCYNFTVDPGEMLTFLIDNSRPGGDPRTIGYWKNWNRCTGGGQAANADNSGGPAFGVFLMEDLLPQLIGDFNVVTCQQGVKILGKQDQGGKNKANDAAYELAAQLLAAKLNLAAGAETCQAVADAIVAAQNLLDSLNFTGSGGYLDSKVKGPLATQRTLALGLANTLDQYNNGNLCL